MMKMRPEHYEHMRRAMEETYDKEVAKVGADKMHDYRDQVSDKRFRWDLCTAAGLIKFITDNLYDYLHDGHIDTALKDIVKSIDDREK